VATSGPLDAVILVFILFLIYARCDPLFLLCALVGRCLGGCQCSCSLPCQGKQMANRSFPRLAAGEPPSHPVNFMLLCVAMATPSQRSPAGSLCLCDRVRAREREREREMDKWTESEQTEPGSNSLIYPHYSSSSSSSSVLFSSSTLFAILCHHLPSGRPSSQTQCSWAQLSMFPHTDRPFSGPLYLFGWRWICSRPPRGGARSCELTS